MARSIAGDATQVAVEAVSGEARAQEISEMLGSAGDASLRNAREILAQTAEMKRGNP